MEPIKPIKTFKVYALIRQSGITMNYVYGGSTSSAFGPGFYSTREEAEQLRTVEILKDTTGSGNKYHVFELEIPNPVYQE
jgi:hypothetical protein